jgi:hypothetical protein
MLSSQSTPQYFSNLDDAFDSFPPARDDGLECLAAGDVLKEFVDVLRQRDGWNKLTVSGARKRVAKWLEYRREHGGGLDVGDAGAGSDIAEDEQLDQLASLDPAAADAAVDAALSGGVSGGEDVGEAADVAVEAADVAVEAADAAVGMDVAVEAADGMDVAAQDVAVEAADVAVDAADAAVGMDVAVEAVEAVVAQDDVVEDSSTPETAAERVLVARVDESTRTYTASLVSFLDGVLRGESPDSSSGLCLGGVLPVGEHAAPFYRYQVVLRSLLEATDTLGARHMSLLESYSAPCVGGGSFPSLEDFIARQGTLDSLRDMIVHETFHGNDMDKIQQWVQQSQAEKARLESLYESEKKAHEQPRPVVADVLLQPVVVQKKKKAQRGGKRKGGNGGEGGSGSSKKKMTNKDVLKKMEQEYCSRDPVVGANDSAFYESVEREIVHGLIGGQGIRSHLAIGIDGGYGLPGMHLKACACAQCQAAEKHGTTVGVDTDGVDHCPSWSIRMRVVLWTGELIMDTPDLDLWATRKQTNGPQLPLPSAFKSWSQSMKTRGLFTGRLTSLHYYSHMVVGRPYVADADASGLMAGWVNETRSVLLLVPLQMVHRGVVERLGQYGFSFATSLSGRERLSKEKLLALVPNEYNGSTNIVEGGRASIFRPDSRTREYKLEQLSLYRGYFHLLEPSLRAMVDDDDWTKLTLSDLVLLTTALSRIQQEQAAASAGLASP